MSWIDELRDTVGRFDPTFAAALRPATAIDRDRLEARLGCALPRPLAELVEAMGEDDGGLSQIDDCTTRLSMLVRVHDIRPDRIPIGVGMDLRYWLRTEIVALEVDDDPEIVVSPSLPAWTFDQAFRWEMVATGQIASFTGATGRKPAGTPRWRVHLADRLQQLGYTRQRFESSIRWLFRSEAKLVVLVGDRSDRQIVTGGGRDDASFRAAVADLEQIGDGRPVRVDRRPTLTEARARRRPPA